MSFCRLPALRQLPAPGAWRLSGTLLLAGAVLAGPADASAAAAGSAARNVVNAACPGAPTAPDIACTGLGAVRGVAEGDTMAFKGIPYALPPTGALRWKPPQPARTWAGVRNASAYGAACPQLVGKTVEGNEDCLFVNVWRPAAKPSKPLPVMIWLTGGGNHSYSGAGSPGFGKVVYDGRALVQNDVVMVTYNLRLGVLGFLAHPALDAERAEHVSGNYGSLDQIAMLEWVQHNIGAFGGDPKRVFLFGTSAGGGNICALISAPRTRGLIHGASMQSSVPVGCEIQTLADAENGTGRAVAAKLGCDLQANTAADVAACLRSQPVDALVAAIPGTFTVFPRVYGPNMDGVVFPDQPARRIRQGLAPPMPIIIGNTADETQQFINAAGPVTDAASFGTAVAKVFGQKATEEIVAHYPLADYPSPRAAFVKLTTDAEFTCQSRRVARLFAGVQKAPVYRYLFRHVLENDPAQKALGAIHTVEHPFLFAWEGSYVPTATDRAIQQSMLGYWRQMAIAGNPNAAGLLPWPVAGADGDTYLDIGPTIAVGRGPANAQCEFWDTVTLPWPHI